VVIWAFWGSDAVIWSRRAFGAGFGMGTATAGGDGVVEKSCAADGVATLATAAAISNAKAVRRPGIANSLAIRIFDF
jgi:hypothetical protein